MHEVKLGNVYGEHNGSDFAGNVWSTDHICPALTTMQGGGRQPHIVEIKEVAEIVSDRFHTEKLCTDE